MAVSDSGIHLNSSACRSTVDPSIWCLKLRIDSHFPPMAVSNWSSSAMAKASLLPVILVLLAVAAGASSTEDGPTVAKLGGRFSETPVGRKLLALQLCGTGSAPDYSCHSLLPGAKNPKCCTDMWGTQSCWDVGLYYLDHCGSCTKKCKVGEFCCSGVCADVTSDKNHCGVCGHKCHGKLGCKLSMCNDY